MLFADLLSLCVLKSVYACVCVCLNQGQLWTHLSFVLYRQSGLYTVHFHRNRLLFGFICMLTCIHTRTHPSIHPPTQTHANGTLGELWQERYYWTSKYTNCHNKTICGLQYLWIVTIKLSVDFNVYEMSQQIYLWTSNDCHNTAIAGFLNYHHYAVVRLQSKDCDLIFSWTQWLCTQCQVWFVFLYKGSK